MTDEPKDKRQQFLVRVEACFFTDVDEVWPDGDAPENPTTENVIAVLLRAGSFVDFVREWTLDSSGILVTVDGKPVEWRR